MLRTIAFLVAPCLSLLVLWLVQCNFAPSMIVDCSAQYLLIVAVYGGILAYPVAIVAGIPIVYLFFRQGWRAWWQVAGAGALCGLIGAAIGPLLDTRPAVWAEFAGYCVGVGFLSGLIFWALSPKPVSTRAAGS